MSRIERRFARAVRVVPRPERQRFAAEWRADLVGAQELGVASREVVRGAGRVARRRRVRHWGAALSGARGGARAAVAWSVALVALVFLFAFGGVLFVLAIPVAVVLAVRASVQQPGQVWRIVMVSAATVWIVCSLAFLWLWNVGFDARDAMLPDPRSCVGTRRRSGSALPRSSCSGVPSPPASSAGHAPGPPADRHPDAQLVTVGHLLLPALGSVYGQVAFEQLWNTALVGYRPGQAVPVQ